MGLYENIEFDNKKTETQLGQNIFYFHYKWICVFVIKLLIFMLLHILHCTFSLFHYLFFILYTLQLSFQFSYWNDRTTLHHLKWYVIDVLTVLQQKIYFKIVCIRCLPLQERCLTWTYIVNWIKPTSCVHIKCLSPHWSSLTDTITL